MRVSSFSGQEYVYHMLVCRCSFGIFYIICVSLICVSYMAWHFLWWSVHFLFLFFHFFFVLLQINAPSLKMTLLHKTGWLISKPSSCYKSCCFLPFIFACVATSRSPHPSARSDSGADISVIHSDLQSMNKISRAPPHKCKLRNMNGKPQT